MKVDPSSLNENDQSPVNLFVVLSQSSSYDDAKYLLSQLNTSKFVHLNFRPMSLTINFIQGLSQIGQHIAPFKQDMISAIQANVHKKTAISK